MHRVRFAGAIVRKDHLLAHIWLRRKVQHPLLRRVESFGRLGYGLQFQLAKPGDVDKEIGQFLREAYEIHQQPQGRLKPKA